MFVSSILGNGPPSQKDRKKPRLELGLALGNGSDMHFYIKTRLRLVAKWFSGRALDLRSLGCGLDSHREQLRSNLSQVVHIYVLCYQAV